MASPKQSNRHSKLNQSLVHKQIATSTGRNLPGNIYSGRKEENIEVTDEKEGSDIAS